MAFPAILASLHTSLASYRRLTAPTDCIPSDTCQTNIVSIENAVTTDYVQIYNLNTIGTTNEIDQDGSVIAVALDNHATYPDTIAFYHN